VRRGPERDARKTREVTEQTPVHVISGFAEAYLALISTEISPADAMLRFPDLPHYFACGASALNLIAGIVTLAEASTPTRILDFGSGAGRVTRWLRAAYPDAAIEACDVREGDVAFCRDRLGVEGWTSSTDIDALPQKKSFDLIWVGSVLTHLSAESTVRLLRRWIDWTNPGGLVIATLHGRTAVDLAASGKMTYSASWETILEGWRRDGYGYADHPDSPGYGISLTSMAWTAALVASWPDVRLVALAERAWDHHHDVVSLQKV
jgi:SAM-dependent methyltransferase